MGKRVRSTIIKLDINAKGKKYGYIKNETERGLYFNAGSLSAGVNFDSLNVGDTVSYELTWDVNSNKMEKVINLVREAARPHTNKKQNAKPFDEGKKGEAYKPVITPPIPFKTEKEIFSGSSFSGTKSAAKVVGVKSVFYHDEKIVTTSFGKGNKAIMEKVLHDGSIQDLHNPAAYEMDFKKRELYFRNQKTQKEAVISNPANMKISQTGGFDSGKVGLDQTRLKEPLEKEIFGAVYPDNFHIQIAYNILDIEKILAQHIGNIIYSLNNVIPDNGGNDFVGNMGYIKKYSEFGKADKQYSKFGKADKQYSNFEKFVTSPKLAYFGNAFYFEKNKSVQRKDKADIYYTILLCGAVRQFCAHAYDKYKLAIYSFDKDQEFIYIKDFLDRLYDAKIKEVNNSFWSTSGKSMAILMDILNITTEEGKKELVKDYYDFTVTKDNKNLGLSLKVLREAVLTLPQAAALREYVDKNQNSRRFIFKAIDFILFRDYKDYASASGIIDRLRGCQNKEEKIAIYQAEAKKAWERNGRIITTSVIKVVDDKIAERIQTQSLGIDRKMLDGIQLESRNTSSFTKLIYMITMLLDGKEINDLLTTLVSKFENIHSLCTIYSEVTGRKAGFKNTHRLFENSDKVAQELRAVNSFARMEKALVKTKKEMFMDAARVLGTDKTDAVLDKYFEQMLDKSNSDKGLRNFIVNNVMESSRFRYLVRYADTKTVCRLAQNDNLIRFVLGDIPQPQIDRYYISCGGKKEAVAQKEKIDFLVEKIKNVRFENFENIKQGNNATTQQKLEKELGKNIIGLYLTYLYLVTKNLVNVNSRYFMAFHCLERDSAFKSNRFDSISYSGCFDITTEYITQTNGKAVLNPKACEYMAVNMANSDEKSVKLFRNTVSHLGAVRKAYAYVDDIIEIKSYYSLYHYIVQREIFSLGKNCKTAEIYSKAVADYKSYSKDMVKALCSPLGYNLPRFKNLTTEYLFDKNKPQKL